MKKQDNCALQLCWHCDASIPRGSVVCPYCGNSLEIPLKEESLSSLKEEQIFLKEEGGSFSIEDSSDKERKTATLSISLSPLLFVSFLGLQILALVFFSFFFKAYSVLSLAAVREEALSLILAGIGLALLPWLLKSYPHRLNP